MLTRLIRRRRNRRPCNCDAAEAIRVLRALREHQAGVARAEHRISMIAGITAAGHQPRLQ